MPRLRHAAHHAVRADGDDAVHLVQRDRRCAELARGVGAPSPRRCCRRSCGPAAAPGVKPGASSQHQTTTSAAASISLHLVAVDHLLVAGEVEHRRARSRAAPARSRTAPRCPGRRRPAAPSRPPAISVGVPVGPIRITGSPGFSSAHRSDEPPISSTIRSTAGPRSRSTQAPVSARPSIASVVPSHADGASVSKFCSR